MKGSEVRRILDPRHGTKVSTLERFIRSSGGDVLVSAGQEIANPAALPSQ